MIRNEIKKQIFLQKYKDKHIRIGKDTNIFSTVKFGGNNSIGDGTTLGGSIGEGSYCASDCFLLCDIGKYCSIGNRVRVSIGTHPSHTWVSTHPAFFSVKKQAGFTFADHQKLDEFAYADGGNYVKIGNDVWIGDDVQILQGVTIGDGAIIAAGAVVTKNVKPYTVVGGVPAKEIRKRFSDEQIDFLLKFQWSNKGEAWIRKHAGEFENIETAMKEWMKHE